MTLTTTTTVAEYQCACGEHRGSIITTAQEPAALMPQKLANLQASFAVICPAEQALVDQANVLVKG